MSANQVELGSADLLLVISSRGRGMRLNRIAPASRRSVSLAQFSEGHRTRGRRIINPTCRRKIALFPLSLPHTGIGQRPGRGRKDRGIERHAAWSRQLLNAALRSPARVVFRHLAILPNPSLEAPERRYGGDFQGQGLRDPRRRSDDALATECRGRLHVPRDHWSR